MEIQPETDQPKKRNLKPYIIVLILLAVFFGLGYAVGEGRVKFASGRLEITKGDVPNTSADYSLLWDALSVLNTKFVDRPLDQQQLLYGAVRGLVEAAGDPYTVFFDPDEATQFAEELRGSFEGIGAEIGVKDDQLVVIAPIEDTPASRAGIRSGDAILAIDGESTIGMTAETAASKIRGKTGTEVKLRILHKNDTEPLDLTITRAKIEIRSVKFETRELEGKKIAIIKINRFGEDTKRLFDHNVEIVTGGNYQGLVIDLRNNPGGYLETAVNTASNWVDSGKIVVKEVGFDGTANDYTAQGIPRLKGIKTVVLVNAGSASASEILAGALQDYGLATLVGEKTYGKGSVQELEELKDNSEVKITIAKWFTPNGRGIDKTGLEPDIKVERTSEDFDNNLDPQMDKAIELLK